ncbi:protein COFACTOR ASSEMBLY OF COMPLEX C SUBUNIT B CCB3, chloroplastic-like isoform X2 [Amaranthus tricolor]|uniref:protein COFACTOR ASSEMBLY OF COMPLEX C SUBUNIT B CCB3, chloroplastic-like isoform X2 n=1 Tax=Amaranthus tricolor TaxID=29722 RepID=UPI00258B80DF|nr:protein COFACTOR ASSEMBLY OF COMPLEX C SUBUNIT B CCB3, chloroplastic-like isoform X2 [Amaranthus tricolor]
MFWKLSALSASSPIRCWSTSRRNLVQSPQITRYSPRCVLGVTIRSGIESLHKDPGIIIPQPCFGFDLLAGAANNKISTLETSQMLNELKHSLLLTDLDPATAKAVVPFIGPFLSAFSFLFILRIVMSWYPKLPLGKFPYVLAYAPTEPLLVPTRKVIPPLGGVDVTPVVWFGLLSFLNEILVGPQGLLVLLSQQT